VPRKNRGVVERRRDRRLWWVTAIALIAAAVVGSTIVLNPDDGCDEGSGAPSSEVELMPRGLSFDEIGTVTRVRQDGPNVSVQAVTAEPPEEAAVLIQDAVIAAGYRPAGMDSDGVEAEVFFTSGDLAGGQARVRPRPGCDDRWDIDLVLVDRDP
jgi:hypothetical protein